MGFQKAEIRDLLTRGLSPAEIREKTGYSRQTISYHAKDFVQPRTVSRPIFTKPTLPSAEMPIEKVIDLAVENYTRNREAYDARKLIQVKVNMDGPIGLHLFGDPHLDDNGCNWPYLMRDIEAVRDCEGMMAATVGDMRNNWVGRLAKLYANQQMTDKNARRLIEWFFKDAGMQWLFINMGNHDAWNSEGGNALDYILANAGLECDGHDAKIALNFPNGNVCTIRSRHNFKGKSQYNTVHGMIKAALMGRKFDIYVCGDWHHTGYMKQGFADMGWGHQQNDYVVCELIRLGTYKEMDEYAEEGGFPDQNWSPSATCIINPYATSPRTKVTTFWDTQEAADYLTWLRKRFNEGKSMGGRAAHRAV